VERLVNYALETPEDPFTSAGCVAQRIALIERNLAFLNERGRND
jgi:4-O-beta-D-mannosyl-D-glucose phosphorylase